jgi:HAMP domain-containing protein
VRFSILLCFVLLSVLLVLIEQPLEQLMETIARLRQGDLSARVDFAKREDDIGQLGRQFNGMIQRQQLAGPRIFTCSGRSMRAATRADVQNVPQMQFHSRVPTECESQATRPLARASYSPFRGCRSTFRLL